MADATFRAAPSRPVDGLRDTDQTMPQDNVRIVRQVFEAFNSEDIARIVEFTHPDFVAEVSAEISTEPDTYRGHDGIRRYFDSFQEAMYEIRFQAEQFWEVGESVVVALWLTARGRQTGIPVEQRTAGVWTIRDGRVLRIQAYSSASQALEAVGLGE
jgi:ketosteroid isomerase-like protein